MLVLTGLWLARTGAPTAPMTSTSRMAVPTSAPLCRRKRPQTVVRRRTDRGRGERQHEGRDGKRHLGSTEATPGGCEPTQRCRVGRPGALAPAAVGGGLGRCARGTCRVGHRSRLLGGERGAWSVEGK